MTDQPRVEWRGRADFAEIAESLGVTTDCIMAVHSEGIVLYTPYPETDDPEIHRALLYRHPTTGVVFTRAKSFVALTSEFHAFVDEAARRREQT